MVNKSLPKITINDTITFFKLPVNCTEATLSNSTRALLWFEIRPTKMLMAV